MLVPFHSKLKCHVHRSNHNPIAETLKVSCIKSHLSAEELGNKTITSTGMCFLSLIHRYWNKMKAVLIIALNLLCIQNNLAPSGFTTTKNYIDTHTTQCTQNHVVGKKETYIHKPKNLLFV